MLEAVNYIEHYGLLRKSDANGNFESIDNRHSWDAPQVLTNVVLFKVQRHADHHTNVYKPYQILNSYPESPLLPQGYTLTMIVAFFPYVFMKIHNPLAEAAQKNEKVEESVREGLEKWITGTLLASFAV